LEENMLIQTVGIDLGKTVFHVVGLHASGTVALKRRFSRSQLLAFMANLPACLIGMEACCGAHHLGRDLAGQGHTVRLIPAQFVRPFVKSNKNDFIDAEAIAEAVQRPTMRFVQIKTEEQLDLQALHRVRDRLVSRRTGVINQIRAFLLERGIVRRKGREFLSRHMPALLHEGASHLSPAIRRLLQLLWSEWQALEEQIAAVTDEIERTAKQDTACIRLTAVPGIGSLVSTALVASIGNGSAFSRGRDLAAWLGLVPRQHSTGGKPRLLGISKRGNAYLRRMLIHGARSVITQADRAKHPLGVWMSQLESRMHRNAVIVALANKIARIAWAVLSTGKPYRGMVLADA
jgi:transposase